MDDLRVLIRRAARRLEAGLLLQGVHVAWIVAGSLLLALVLAAKGTPAVREAMDWRWLVPALLGTGVVGALVWWTRRRPTPLHVAIQIDERLDLREKISTAMLCRGREDAFARAAVEDALAVARSPEARERLGRAFAVRPPRRWWISPALLLAALAAGWFLPEGNVFARHEEVLAAEEQAEIQRVQAQVEEAIAEVAQQLGTDVEKVKEMLGETDSPNVASTEPKTPEEAKREAFKKMSELSDALREITEGEKARAVDDLVSRLNQLALSKEGPADELAAALKQGDFAQAKQALEELKKQAEQGQLSPEEKAALQEQLQELAERMEELAKQNQALQEALKRAGVDPNLANNPEALQKALEELQNMPADEKQQLMQMAQSMQAAAQMCQNLGGACQAMAGQMGQMGQAGAMGQMGEQLSQLEMMQNEMQAMRAQMQKLAAQCQGLGQGAGQGMGQGLSQNQAAMQWMQMMQMGGRGPGMGMRGQGSGGRGARLAAPTNLTPDQASVENQEGEIIGTMLVEGEQVIRGESRARFADFAAQAGRRAQEELEDDLIPIQYKEAIQSFFGELEAKAEVVTSNGGQ